MTNAADLEVSALGPNSPIAIDDVIITHELAARPLRLVNIRGEIASMHSLANACHDGPGNLLKLLARLAVDLCGAGTGGVSLIEASEDGTEHFRWRALAGDLAHYEGGTTPRDWSPCGFSLKAGKTVLYSYPARHFTYFQQIETPIVEGLVIPIYLDSLPIGTIWIVSHNQECHFDLEDVRVMTSLGAFAAGALSIAALRRECKPLSPAARAELERAIVWSEYVRRIARGDQAALAALYDETGSLVFTTALRIVSSAADAEEVAADVYSSVWKTASTFDAQRGSVSAWLVSMSRSRAVDRLRKRATRAKYEAAASLVVRPAIDGEHKFAEAQTREHLLEALEALPTEQRRVIELAYFAGLPATEIAERLGTPVGTVKTRVRMGLMKLRRIFADQGPRFAGASNLSGVAWRFR